VVEKRRDRRVPLRVQVFVRNKEFEGTIFFYSANISTGGIFLESDLLFDVGTEFLLEFTLPLHPGFIRAKGVVVWVTRPGVIGQERSDPPGMGIKFVEISDEDRKKLEEFIARKLSRS